MAIDECKLRDLIKLVGYIISIRFPFLVEIWKNSLKKLILLIEWGLEMKFFVAFLFSGLLGATAFAGDSFDPDTTEFSWKNGPERDSIYVVKANWNSVHVWEAYSID